MISNAMTTLYFKLCNSFLEFVDKFCNMEPHRKQHDVPGWLLVAIFYHDELQKDCEFLWRNICYCTVNLTENLLCLISLF
jgi:hypothetical protein